jgi:hypothetical protein
MAQSEGLLPWRGRHSSISHSFAVLLRFRRYFLFETYLASEGFFAYQSRLHADGMKLIVNNGIYFEFVPFTDEIFRCRWQSALTIPADAACRPDRGGGRECAWLTSTCAGAWRYLLGDTVRVQSLKHLEIDHYRTHQALPRPMRRAPVSRQYESGYTRDGRGI